MADRHRHLELESPARRSIGPTGRGAVRGAILAGAVSFGALAESPVEDICADAPDPPSLCDAVGKRAVILPSSVHMPRVELGTIIGVAWLRAGALICRPDLDQSVERAARDGHYFIIESDAADGATLLRPVSRTEPR